jgi:hypothetical protein
MLLIAPTAEHEMGSWAHFKCQNCDYLSGRISLSGSSASGYLCRHCKSIVNAERKTFRFDLDPCPLCNGYISPRDWIYDPSWNYLCLRCGVGELHNESVEFYVEPYDGTLVLPTLGQIVHGTTMSAIGLIKLANSPIVAKSEAASEKKFQSDETVECEVVALDKYVHVRILRALTIADL